MIDVIVPVEQEGTQAVVRAWLKKVGDRVEENDPLVELETDKVAVEVPAPAAGVLREILIETDAEAVPGAVLGRISVESGEDEASSRRRPGPQREQPPSPSPDGIPASAGMTARDLPVELRLSPAVKRACLQHDIDPRTIPGTGRDGRVTRADVDRAVEAATKVEVSQPSDASLRSHSVPHDRMRLKIAENMLASVTQAPHVTAVFEADFSAIIAHRERHKAAWAKKGVKLTYSA